MALTGGSVQTGGIFQLPFGELERLAQLERQLTKDERDKIIKAIKRTPGFNANMVKQGGGLLGTVLAPIGVPLLMSALTGKGLSVGIRRPGTYQTVRPPPKKTGGGKKKHGKKPPPPPQKKKKKKKGREGTLT